MKIVDDEWGYSIEEKNGVIIVTLLSEWPEVNHKSLLTRLDVIGDSLRFINTARKTTDFLKRRSNCTL